MTDFFLGQSVPLPIRCPSLGFISELKIPVCLLFCFRLCSLSRCLGKITMWINGKYERGKCEAFTNNQERKINLYSTSTWYNPGKLLTFLEYDNFGCSGMEDSEQNSNIENGDDKNYQVEQGNNAMQWRAAWSPSGGPMWATTWNRKAETSERVSAQKYRVFAGNRQKRNWKIDTSLGALGAQNLFSSLYKLG